MRFLPRLLILGGLAYLCFVLFREGQHLAVQDAADPSRIFVVFGGALLSALTAGIIVALTILPMLGQGLANLIYGETEIRARDPLTLARERIADGEFLEAQSFYRQALAATPDDTAAIGELVDLQIHHLETPAAAAEILEKTLALSWPSDEEAFLRNKLAEAYSQQGHATQARALLLETIAAHPETAAARRAEHLLQEFQ